MIDIAMGMNFHSPHGLSFSHKLNHGLIDYEFDLCPVRSAELSRAQRQPADGAADRRVPPRPHRG